MEELADLLNAGIEARDTAVALRYLESSIAMPETSTTLHDTGYRHVPWKGSCISRCFTRGSTSRSELQLAPVLQAQGSERLVAIA